MNRTYTIRFKKRLPPAIHIGVMLSFPHPYTPPDAARAIARSVRRVRWATYLPIGEGTWFPPDAYICVDGVRSPLPRYPRVDRPIAAWRAW